MAEKLTPILPGEVLLEEFMKPLNISEDKLAEDINVPVSRISEIISGRKEISADTALRLGRYFSIEPEFWINLQTRYSMKKARSRLGARLDKEVKVHSVQQAGR